jgi:hypothetical protein
MADTRHQIRLDARLGNEAVVPRHGPNRWPLPVVDRVRGLVAIANEEGARTNQAELVAALICGLNPTGTVLKAWVEEYRLMPVRKTLLQPSRARTKVFVASGAGRPRGT